MVTVTNAFTCYTSPVRRHRALCCYNGVGKDSIHFYEVTKTIFLFTVIVLQIRICLRNESKCNYHGVFLTKVILHTFTSTDMFGTHAYCFSGQALGRKYSNERNTNIFMLPESLILGVSSFDLPKWF